MNILVSSCCGDASVDRNCPFNYDQYACTHPRSPGLSIPLEGRPSGCGLEITPVVIRLVARPKEGGS